MSQEEMIQKLQDDPQQQKMLNEIFKATNEAIKKEFPIFAKLVQADVSNAIMAAASKEGQVSDKVVDLYSAVNGMMGQVGKDLDKQMMEKFAALNEEIGK